ncbi:MAG: hypothetical protein PHW10_01120 [Candidatus Peribacteraceae bacterium]|nr:hypothetical protein [Candidatus Peribacteraceae bacterium]
MPLKHFTETLLVIALGIVAIVTGVLVSTLPALPQGALPWLIVLALGLAYPLSLYPLLKRNRADYSFRLLHFLPALAAIVWLALQLLQSVPGVSAFLSSFLFGWALPWVALSFLLLILFCLHVIRRRVPRITALLLLFVPFLLLSLYGEGAWDGQERLQASLWRGHWWDLTSTVASSSSSMPGIVASSGGKSGTVASAVISAGRSSRPVLLASSSSKPPSLPSAGPGMDILLMTLGALYMGTLHRRARKRMDQPKA